MKRMDVCYEKFTLEDSRKTFQLVNCFKEVFSENPWGEWMTCSVCGNYWGKESLDKLIKDGFYHCNTALRDFWTHAEVMQDIVSGTTEQSSNWIAKDNDKIIGFCWGNYDTIKNLESYLAVNFDSSQYKKLSNFRLGYQSELGVISGYRGNKIAKQLAYRRLLDFLRMSVDYVIVRVKRNPEPSKTYSWYIEKLGYNIIAEYPNGDGRVILGRPIDGLLELFDT